MKDLTATLILLLTGLNTLSIEIWQHARDREYAAAAPCALLLIALSGVPVHLLMRGHMAEAQTYRRPGFSSKPAMLAGEVREPCAGVPVLTVAATRSKVKANTRV